MDALECGQKPGCRKAGRASACGCLFVIKRRSMEDCLQCIHSMAGYSPLLVQGAAQQHVVT